MVASTDFSFAGWLSARLQQRQAVGTAPPRPVLGAEQDRSTLGGAHSGSAIGTQDIGAARIEPTLVQALAVASSPDLFVQAAKLPESQDFGVLSYALASSPQAVSGLELLLTHPAFQNPSVRVHIAGRSDEVPPLERVRVQFTALERLSEDAEQALTLELFASVVGLVRWRDQLRDSSSGAFQIYLNHQEPTRHRGLPSRESVESFVGATPEYGHARSELLLDLSTEAAGLGYRRSRQAFDRARVLLGEQGQALCQRHVSGERLNDQLVRALVGSFGTIGRADRAAAALHTSERTMRRRLAQEDTSFQRVLDAYRCALAEDYLADTRLSTQQIGELLGFTEATNFRRAFLRWTGQSPHDHRNALKRSA